MNFHRVEIIFIGDFTSEIVLHFISSRIDFNVALNLLLSNARGLNFHPHYLMLLKTKRALMLSMLTKNKVQ